MVSSQKITRTLTDNEFKGAFSLEDIEKITKQYRKIYYFKREQKSNTHNSRIKKDSLHRINAQDYVFNVERPFFCKISRSDHIYVRSHRMIIYSIIQYSKSMEAVVMRSSGYNLGKILVRKGVIKSLDDLPKIFILQRIGVLDIVDESLNNMKINIYECMSCYGMENIGMTMCDFEAGVIEGVLEKLYGKNTAIEKYCWGKGNSFCGFEIYFE